MQRKYSAEGVIKLTQVCSVLWRTRVNINNYQDKVTNPIIFYRAMHYSAKRGLAIACRLSVRLAVTLVDCDHIGWNCSKIISRLFSLRCSLSPQTPTMTGLRQGKHPEIWAQSVPPPVDFITCTTPSMPRLGETPYLPMQAGPKGLRGV